MVLVKMLMEIALPKMGELLVMMMTTTMISPFRREVPPAESLHRRAKVFLPKFRLEMAVLHPECPLLIFSRSKDLMYQKMGTGGGLGWPQPTRARLGSLACPGGLCPPGGSPLVVICSNIFIYCKTILHKFSAHLEMCRIGNADVAFSGSRIPTAGILPLCVNLAYYERKAIRITP